MSQNIRRFFKKLQPFILRLEKNSTFLWGSVIIAYLLPAFFALKTVLLGYIPFWFDPARDLLTAWNFGFRTLIGPPSGIPNLFYGPYWIWLLHFGQLFSKNPRIVVLISLTLPYIVIFPLILSQFSRVFSKSALILIWVFFMFSSGLSYATQIWNPYPAPAIFFILLYILSFTDYSAKGWLTPVRVFIAGAASGLILNFHTSLGVGIAVGSFFFLIIESIQIVLRNKKNWVGPTLRRILLLGLFGAGIVFMFAPFFLFEIRHNFNQIKVILATLQKMGNVVGVVGMSKPMVLVSFWSNIIDILMLPFWVATIGTVTSIGYYIYSVKTKTITLTAKEKQLGKVILSVTAGILFVYLTARNPIWDYHFVGVEILSLLFLGLIVTKLPVVRNVLVLWACAIIITNFVGIFKAPPRETSTSLVTEEETIDSIVKDAGDNPYTVFTYNPAIYTYEYSYIFRWKAKKDVPYDPGTIHADTDIVYFIFPKDSEKMQQGYMSYRTSDDQFATAKSWDMRDGYKVVKRVKTRKVERGG